MVSPHQRAALEGVFFFVAAAEGGNSAVAAKGPGVAEPIPGARRVPGLRLPVQEQLKHGGEAARQSGAERPGAEAPQAREGRDR